MVSGEIQQAQNQLAQQRTAIEQRQREAQQASQQLQQARSSLPNVTSQQALRQQYAGLQGRNTRRQVMAKNEEIATREGEVAAFKGELSRAEKEVASYEAQVNTVAAEERAQELAMKHIKKGYGQVYLDLGENPLVKKYIKEYYGSGNVRNIQAMKKKQESIGAQLIAGELPSSLKDALANLKSKGLTEEKAYQALGLKVEAKPLPEMTTKFSASNQDIIGIVSPSYINKTVNHNNTKEIRLYSDTQGLNIPKPINNNGFSITSGSIIGYGNRVYNTTNNKSSILDSSWFSRALESTTKKAKEITELGNKTLISAEIPTATLINPSSSGGKTFTEYSGEPPTIKQVFVYPILSKTYTSIKDKNLFGKPIWAIVQGVPTYNTKMDGGKLVLSNINKITGRAVESGRAVQATYDVSRATVKGTNVFSERLIRDYPEMFSSPEEQAKLTESFKSPIVRARENVIDWINPRQVVWDLDKGTETLGERKGGLLRNVAAGTTQFFMPSNLVEVAPVATLVYGGGIIKALPASVGYGIGLAGGATSIYGYTKASTSEQKMAYGAGIALSTIPFLYGGGKYIKAKTQAGVYEKFFTPEISEVSLKERVGYNPIKTDRNVPRVELVSEDDIFRLNTKTKARGSLNEIDLFGTGEYSGSVTEQIDMRGKVKRVVDYFGLGKPNKLTTFTGRASLNPEGEFNSIVEYGKYTKVTNMKSSGEGKVELFRGKKLVASREMLPNEENNLDNVRNKILNVKIDEQVNNPLNIDEASFSLGNVRIKNLKGVVSQEGGEAVFNIEGNAPEPNLKATKVTGSITSKVMKTTNLDKGVINFNIQDYGFTDIIQTGPRKGQIEVRASNKFINLKRQIGQKIVVGEDIESDKVFRNLQGDKLRMKKTISPMVDRTITEGQQGELFQIRVNPKSKLLDPAKELAAISLKRTTEIVKGIKSERNLQRAKEILGAYDEMLKKLNSKVEPPGKVQELGITISDTGDNLPSMVGGRGLRTLQPPKLSNEELQFLANLPKEVSAAPSSNYLQGMKSSSISIPMGSVAPGNTQAGNIKPMSGLIYDISNDENQALKMQIKTETTQMEALTIPLSESQFKSKLKVKQQMRAIDKQKIIPQLKELYSAKFIIRLNNKQLSEQKALQSVKSRLNQKQKSNQPRPNKPTEEVPPPIINKDHKVRRDSKISLEGFGKLIEIFARRKGKDILIGEAQTGKEAGEFLSSKLKSSLAASGFARIKGGDKLTLSQLGLGGREFRTAKKDMFRVVQERGFRLGTRSEVREIMGEKKRKGKLRRIKIW